MPRLRLSKMTVYFFGSVLEYTGGEKSHDAGDSQDLNVLIEKLGIYYGEAFREYLLAEGTCFFLVNGKGIATTGGLKTRLEGGDKIEILPHIGAG